MKKISRNTLLALAIALTASSSMAFAQTATVDEPKAKKSEATKVQADDSDKDKEDDAKKENEKTTSKKSNFTRVSPDFISIFEPASKSMEAATVQVLSGGRQVALGTIIDADGLILTKASELKRDLKCQIGDEEFEAEVIGIHGKTDLALLKIDAEALNVIRWSEKPANQVGNWVVSPKAQGGDTTVGVISTLKLRQIKPSRAFVGITMVEDKDGIKITSVVNRSPADISGLLVQDVIFKFDGQPVKKIEEFKSILGQFDAGDRVTLDVIRFKEEIQVRVTLAEFEKLSPSSQRSNQQNSMGSKLSRRRKDFPLALQHDSMLQSNTCGGPLLDISGEAVGINIARAGRVASYALPIETVLPIIELLKTGELAPAIVNKEKIAALTAELKQLKADLETLPEKKAVLDIQINSKIAVRDEQRKTLENLEKLLADQEKRLSESQASLDELHKRMKSVRKKSRTGDKTTNRLKQQLDRLKTGSW